MICPLSSSMNQGKVASFVVGNNKPDQYDQNYTLEVSIFL